MRSSVIVLFVALVAVGSAFPYDYGYEPEESHFHREPVNYGHRQMYGDDFDAEDRQDEKLLNKIDEPTHAHASSSKSTNSGLDDLTHVVANQVEKYGPFFVSLVKMAVGV